MHLLSIFDSDYEHIYEINVHQDEYKFVELIISHILSICNANDFVSSFARRATSLRQHFICRKATSFVCVRFPDNEVDSKLSNEVLASLVTKLCPADINEKTTTFCRRLSIFVFTA